MDRRGWIWLAATAITVTTTNEENPVKTMFMLITEMLINKKKFQNHQDNLSLRDKAFLILLKCCNSCCKSSSSSSVFQKAFYIQTTFRCWAAKCNNTNLSCKFTIIHIQTEIHSQNHFCSNYIFCCLLPRLKLTTCATNQSGGQKRQQKNGLPKNHQHIWADGCYLWAKSKHGGKILTRWKPCLTLQDLLLLRHCVKKP